jgi:hypothetical protein
LISTLLVILDRHSHDLSIDIIASGLPTLRIHSDLFEPQRGHRIETEIIQGSSLSPLIERLRDRINQNHEALEIDLAVEIETILSDRILAPQDYDDSIFCQQAIDRWGQGSGYKVDVLSLYDRQVATIDTIFVDLIGSAWRDRIIQPILTFLGD